MPKFLNTIGYVDSSGNYEEIDLSVASRPGKVVVRDNQGNIYADSITTYGNIYLKGSPNTTSQDVHYLRSTICFCTDASNEKLERGSIHYRTGSQGDIAFALRHDRVGSTDNVYAGLECGTVWSTGSIISGSSSKDPTPNEESRVGIDSKRDFNTSSDESHTYGLYLYNKTGNGAGNYGVSSLRTYKSGTGGGEKDIIRVNHKSYDVTLFANHINVTQWNGQDGKIKAKNIESSWDITAANKVTTKVLRVTGAIDASVDKCQSFLGVLSVNADSSSSSYGDVGTFVRAVAADASGTIAENYVHKTGSENEEINGVKTFTQTINANGGINCVSSNDKAKSIGLRSYDGDDFLTVYLQSKQNDPHNTGLWLSYKSNETLHSNQILGFKDNSKDTFVKAKYIESSWDITANGHIFTRDLTASHAVQAINPSTSSGSETFVKARLGDSDSSGYGIWIYANPNRVGLYSKMARAGGDNIITVTSSEDNKKVTTITADKYYAPQATGDSFTVVPFCNQDGDYIGLRTADTSKNNYNLQYQPSDGTLKTHGLVLSDELTIRNPSSTEVYLRATSAGLSINGSHFGSSFDEGQVVISRHVNNGRYNPFISFWGANQSRVFISGTVDSSYNLTGLTIGKPVTAQSFISNGGITALDDIRLRSNKDNKNYQFVLDKDDNNDRFALWFVEYVEGNAQNTDVIIDKSYNNSLASFHGTATNATNVYQSNVNDQNHYYRVLCSSQDVGGYVGIYKGEQITMNPNTGDFKATSFTATSDKRLKENLTPYTPSKSILDLPVYKFDFKEGAKNQIGCLAQDLQEICPEIVNEDDKGYLGIQESKIIYLLLDEVKKLKEKVERLEK